MGVYGTLLVKVLFCTPLLFAHRTLYRPNARGGPSSRLSQFLELCVVTRNFRSTREPDYPNVQCNRHLLGLRCFTTRVPGYSNFGTQLFGRTRNWFLWSVLFTNRLTGLGYPVTGLGYLLLGRSRNGNLLGLLNFSHRLTGLG